MGRCSGYHDQEEPDIIGPQAARLNGDGRSGLRRPGHGPVSGGAGLSGRIGPRARLPNDRARRGDDFGDNFKNEEAEPRRRPHAGGRHQTANSTQRPFRGSKRRKQSGRSWDGAPNTQRLPSIAATRRGKLVYVVNTKPKGTDSLELSAVGKHVNPNSYAHKPSRDGAVREKDLLLVTNAPTWFRRERLGGCSENF